MRLLFFILIALFPFSGFSSTTIVCHHPGYAGQELRFYTYSDPVSRATKDVFTLKLDKEGKARHTRETNATEFVVCDFGVYRGMLFLEPGQNISLQLPPVREKSFADQKNPYFVPVSFWFATENKTQLNNQVSKFTFELNRVSDKYFNQLYFNQSKNYFDTVKVFIEKNFTDIQNETFEFHKEFSLKLVEADAFRYKPEDYSEIFNRVKPGYFLHPSFTALFDKTFTGLLSFDAKAVNGNNIKKETENENITFLANHLQTKYKLQGEMLDLVLLKILHDAYYSGDFSKTAIQGLILNQRFVKHKNSLIRDASKNISEKITHLAVDTKAPVICLANRDKTRVCTDKNKEKFKYLVFADADMMVMREHLKYLANIHQRYEKYLEIFVILRNTNPTILNQFLEENKITGEILPDENNEYIDLYKIRSFPQCYLLDENHNVVFEDTKAPLDGFEQQFGTFLRMELFERQRNQLK